MPSLNATSDVASTVGDGENFNSSEESGQGDEGEYGEWAVETCYCRSKECKSLQLR